MSDQKVDINVSGGSLKGVVAGSVVIENLVFNAPGPGPRAADPAAPIPHCPYPGLARFGPDNARHFFGREAAIRQLVAAVGRQGLTALVGASGSGKSSVVLAGLAPHLAQTDKWRFTHFRIGTELDRDPFLALARAVVPVWRADASYVERLAMTRQLATGLGTRDLILRDVFAEIRHRNAGRRILLIVDQFEEVFTLVDDEALRLRFIDVLLQGAGDPPVGEAPAVAMILTLRADFYGRALRHRPLADALQGHIENLGPMTRDELALAIRSPAEAAGVTFAPGLVETLLDVVEARPGALPLLQFALREMWLKMKDRQIDRAAYDDIGGVDGALAQRAQAIHDDLTEADPELTEDFRRLFTRLVTLGEGQEDTRRVVDRAELGDRLWSLAQALAGEENRLIVTNAPAEGRETAEVAHEALIRNWPMLVDWIDGDRAFQTWLRHVRPSVDLWSANPADEGPLLRGSLLAQAAEWLERQRDDLGENERAFVEASVAAARRDEEEKEAARKREVQHQTELAREQRRRVRIVGVAAVVALALAGFVGYYAVQAENQRGLAEQSATMARLEALRARDNATGALAALSTVATRAGDWLPAAKFALAAWPRRPNADSVQLQDVIVNLSAVTPALWSRRWTRREYSLGVLGEFLVDTDFLLLRRNDGLSVFGTADGPITAGRSAISGPGFAFSSEEGYFAAIGDDGSARVWTGDLAGPAVRLPELDESLAVMALSGGGKVLAVASYSGQTVLWHTDDLAAPFRELTLEEAGYTTLSSLALSSDAAWIVTASRGGDVFAYAADTGSLLIEAYVGHGENGATVGFVPGRTQFFAMSSEGTFFWDIDNIASNADAGPILGSGAEPFLRLGPGPPTAIAFSEAPQSAVARGTFGGSIEVQSFEGGLQEDMPSVLRLLGHTDAVTSADFSADGRRLLSGGHDGTIRLWDLESAAPLAVFAGSRSKPVVAVRFDPGGETFSVGFNDGTIERLAPTQASVHWYEVPGGDSLERRVTPDGEEVLAQTNDGRLVVIDTETGATTRSLPLPDAPLRDVVVLSDRVVAVTLGSDGDIEVWYLSSDSGDPVLRWRYTRSDSDLDPILVVRISPDGRFVAAGGGGRYSGFGAVWDNSSGEAIVSRMGNDMRHIDQIQFSTDSRAVQFGSGIFSDGGWYDLENPPEVLNHDEVAVATPQSQVQLGGTVRFENEGQLWARSHNGSRIAIRGVGASRTSVHLHDATTGVRLASIEGRNERLREIRFIGDSGRVITLSEENQIAVWDFSDVPEGNAFQVVCALLPDHDLEGVLADHPITIDEPICDEGYDPPLPSWSSASQARNQ